MSKKKRDEIIAAPLIGGVVGVMSYFILYYLAGLKDVTGDVGGMPFGDLISVVMAVVIAAILFGELLANAIEKK